MASVADGGQATRRPEQAPGLPDELQTSLADGDRALTGAAMLETRLQHALSLLGGKSSLALRIRARLAAEADYRRGTHAATMAVLDEVRAAEDAVALAEALSLAHHCLLGPGEVTRRREIAAELVRV